MKPIPRTIIGTRETEKFLNSLSETAQKDIFILCSKTVHAQNKKIFNSHLNLTLYQHREPDSKTVWHYKKLLPPKVKTIIAIGGGSVIDTVKLMSLKFNSVEELDAILYGEKEKIKASDINIIAIPTTCGTGSEATSIAVASDSKNTMKWAVVTDDILPQMAILDSSLLSTIPHHSYAYSAADAITHAIESYLSPKSSPASEEISLTALNILLKNFSDGKEETYKETRYEKMLYGSFLAGCALNSAGAAAVHALAYPLGAELHIPHGLANGTLLPLVLRYNLKVINSKTSEIIKILNFYFQSHKDSVSALREFFIKNGITLRLRDYGIPHEKIKDYARRAISIKRLMSNNIRELSIEETIKIYDQIY